MHRSIRTLTAILSTTFLLTACLGMPEQVTPVSNFDLQRYLGTWYEIARLDHSFERGLQQVTAEYGRRDDGGVSVLNRGYSQEAGQWQEAEGRAYFVNSEDEAYLKVSFFGPFYGSYVIFELDQDNYDYAFVSGPDHSYLWLLARSPNPPAALFERFTRRAAELGFDSDSLIFVEHSPEADQG
jgi:apolipoprotein D and lipocalin family protein